MPARLLALVLAVCCLGCPRRMSFGPEGPLTDPEQLLSLVRSSEEKVIGLKGDAKLRVESPQGKGVVTLFAAVQRPALIHLEQLDFFGKPQSILVSDGTRFGLYQSADGKYYQGPATAQNLARFLPVALPPRDLTGLLLGQVPRIRHEHASLSVDDSARAYKLVLTAGGVQQTLWVHPELHRVLRSEVRGADAFDLELEDLQNVSGVTFARNVKLTSEAAKTTLELRYKDVDLNPSPDLTMFDLAAPPDVPVVEVDAEGNVTSP